MRKSITKLMSFSLALVFTFGLTIMPNIAEASVWFAKKELVPMYGWYVYGGAEVLGVQVPVGFVLDAAGGFIGMKEDCVHISLSTCDDSNLTFWTTIELYKSVSPE